MYRVPSIINMVHIMATNLHHKMQLLKSPDRYGIRLCASSDFLHKRQSFWRRLSRDYNEFSEGFSSPLRRILARIAYEVNNDAV